MILCFRRTGGARLASSAACSALVGAQGGGAAGQLAGHGHHAERKGCARRACRAHGGAQALMFPVLNMRSSSRVRLLCPASGGADGHSMLSSMAKVVILEYAVSVSCYVTAC